MKSYRWLITISLLATLFLSGCTLSRIVPNEKVVGNSATDAATVYFIRPMPMRTRGIADTDIDVELDDKVALRLSAGEYVALKLKPGKVNITLRSLAYLTSNPMPEEVFRSAEFEFNSGQSYLIHTRFTQEEFRGIYFTPEEIDIATAKSFLNRIKPHGELAKANTLDKL